MLQSKSPAYQVQPYLEKASMQKQSSQSEFIGVNCNIYNWRPQEKRNLEHRCVHTGRTPCEPEDSYSHWRENLEQLLPQNRQKESNLRTS